MNTLNHEKMVGSLKAGNVYRRSMLASLTTDVDRDLATLVKKGELEKVAPGLYYKPVQSRFGTLPASDEKLISSFLKDDPFLVYSWNDYNSLGLGLTQLYNRQIVYNRKRHGLFSLGGKEFDFRRPARGFPKKLSKEFLLVDLMNNLVELAEDSEYVQSQIKKNLNNFDYVKINENVLLYAKESTKKYFHEING